MPNERILLPSLGISFLDEQTDRSNRGHDHDDAFVPHFVYLPDESDSHPTAECDERNHQQHVPECSPGDGAPHEDMERQFHNVHQQEEPGSCSDHLILGDVLRQQIDVENWPRRIPDHR